MPLNADQLDAFWAVVQAGSFHKAADALFITQSAVTQRVRALETALGAKVFVRAGRGVALTGAGERLARHCRTQREAEAALLAALRGEAEALAGRLAVGCGSEEGRAWVLPALAALGRQHPGLDCELVIDDALDAAGVLASSRLDAVVADAPLRRRGLRSERLGAIAHVLVASPAIATDWPDAPDAETLRGARAIDFHPDDRITLDFLALAHPEADFSDLRRHFVNDAPAILEWVLAGGGFSVLPLALAAPHLASGALRRFFPDVRRERTLYWLTADAGPSEPARRLMDALRTRLNPTD